MFLFLTLALFLPINPSALDALETAHEEEAVMPCASDLCKLNGHVYGNPGNPKQGHGGGIPCIVMNYKQCVNCGFNEHLGSQFCTQHGHIQKIFKIEGDDCYLYITQYISATVIHWKTIIR